MNNEKVEKKFLLIIEPDPDTRSNLALELRDLAQMTIIEAKDGSTAYSKARNQKLDVVFTDWSVPKIGKLELIKSIRETDGNELVPTLIYTEELEEAKIKTRGLKGVEILAKPVEINTLADKIKELSVFDPDKKKFKLDVDFVNPFIDMAMKTLNGLCGIKGINSLKPYLLDVNEDLDIDISGTLAITSPYFRGSIAVSFNEEIYKTAVTTMIEEKVNNIDKDNQDGAAEIINIIFGNTKAVLNQRGYELHRAIPSVVRGRNHKIYQDSKIPVLLVPFNSDEGRFFIQICVKAI